MITDLLYPDYDGDAITLRNELAAERLKELKEARFGTKASLWLVSALSVLKLVAPPSILLILVGFMSSISIYEKFTEAIGLVLILAAVIFLVVLIWVRGRIPKEGLRESKRGIIRNALPWLFAPVLILGIFFIGYVTPAEMGAVAVGYFVLVGFLQRALTARMILQASVRALQSTGSIFLIVIFAAIYGRLLLLYGMPSTIFDPSLALMEMGIISALCCFLVGPIAAAVISGAVFFPLISGGANLTEISMAMVLGIAVGSIVPPFGPVFVALTRSTKEQFDSLAKGTAAFLLPLLLPSVFVIFGIISVRT